MNIDIETVYLILFFVGLFFAIVTLIFSGLGGGVDAHVDAGGTGVGHVDVGTGGGDLIGHGDVVGGHQTAGHDLHFSPFSPQVIATFATAFGGAGYVSYKLLDHSIGISLVVGLVCGLAVSFLLFVFITKVFFKSQASSEPRTHELIGTTAEVTVAIPANGTGEIGYTTMGSRYTAPAVSTSGEAIPARTIVLIQRITSGLFQVEPVRTNVRK